MENKCDKCNKESEYEITITYEYGLAICKKEIKRIHLDLCKDCFNIGKWLIDGTQKRKDNK